MTQHTPGSLTLRHRRDEAAGKVNSVMPVLVLASSPRYHTSLHCPSILRRAIADMRVVERAAAVGRGAAACGREECSATPWYDWREGIMLTDKGGN